MVTALQKTIATMSAQYEIVLNEQSGNVLLTGSGWGGGIGSPLNDSATTRPAGSAQKHAMSILTQCDRHDFGPTNSAASRGRRQGQGIAVSDLFCGARGGT